MQSHVFWTYFDLRNELCSKYNNRKFVNYMCRQDLNRGVVLILVWHFTDNFIKGFQGISFLWYEFDVLLDLLSVYCWEAGLQSKAESVGIGFQGLSEPRREECNLCDMCTISPNLLVFCKRYCVC